MITAQRVGKAAVKLVSKGIIKAQTVAGVRREHLCPACGAHVVDFFRYGECRQWGCPECGASPRERLVNYLISHGHLKLPKGGTILHVAPGEGSLVRQFSAEAGYYIPSDLNPARYNVDGIQFIDLMAFDFGVPLDLFYASHVMEHVPDDVLVMRNLYAALRPGGEAWLVVPLWDKPSVDGSADLSGREREQLFGQWDHVRQYGLDFADRLRAVGFDVDLLCAKDMPERDRVTMALDDVIFRARKPVVAER